MTEKSQVGEPREGAKEPTILSLFLTHTDNGTPSVAIDPQICIDRAGMSTYFDSVLGEGMYTEEIIPSGSISVILDTEGITRYSLLSADATEEELLAWLQRCGGKLDSVPWKFEMGKGATITELREFTPEEGWDSLNNTIRFLNAYSGLGGWAAGLQRGIQP